MSLHSYSRVWLHLVWATLKREPMLLKPAATKVSAYLIAEQEEHHRKKSFAEELRLLVEKYGLVWREEENR